ncbi:unnamed protein product [Fasciola hepatica]|uniref:Transient receptor potential cation channel subfamily A member 1 n=1 Tax=Fasciola hepatica TaxID=6192 RepID=A0ABC9HH07_FASHE
MNGNGKTCSILLTTDQRLLNEKNGLGMTALHIAAMHKKDEVTEYLLTAGAKILPDNRGIYFTTHLFNQDNYLAAKVVTEHKRWPEIMEMLRNTNQCPLERLVCYMPSLTTFIRLQSEGLYLSEQPDSPFVYPQLIRIPGFPSRLHSWLWISSSRNVGHETPETTGETYGRWVQLLEMVYYAMLCLIITRFALSQMPLTVNYNEPQIQNCMEKRWQYFTRWINCWLFLFNVLFIVNCVLNLTGQHSPACGALTVFVMFMSWMNILLQMLHYRSIGLFVVMFIQVSQTIMKMAPIFCSLFVAFAITFHKLLILPEESEYLHYPRETKNRLAYCFIGYEHLNRSEAEIRSRPEMQLPVRAFGNVNMALFQTLMMILGEYEHTEVITRPYLDGFSATIYTVGLTFAFYAAFAFTMPISLVNLMVRYTCGPVNHFYQHLEHSGCIPTMDR